MEIELFLDNEQTMKEDFLKSYYDHINKCEENFTKEYDSIILIQKTFRMINVKCRYKKLK